MEAGGHSGSRVRDREEFDRMVRYIEWKRADPIWAGQDPPPGANSTKCKEYVVAGPDPPVRIAHANRMFRKISQVS